MAPKTQTTGPRVGLRDPGRPSLNLHVALVFALLLLAGCTNVPRHEEARIADIHGLALDPRQSTRLYVATHHGLFVAENDTGWTSVTQDPFDMMGFTMHPRDGRVMYASGHPARVGRDWAVGVVKSTDAGRSWTTLGLKNQVDFHAMAMEAGSGGAPDTIYGSHGGKLHVSRNGGTDWTAKPLGFQVAALAVDPDTGDVLAASASGLQRVARGIEGSWQAVRAAPSLAVAATADAWLAYFEEGGLSRSTDSGRTWTALNWTVPPNDYPWGIAPDPAGGPTVYVGTARGVVFKTEDAGASWRRIN